MLPIEPQFDLSDLRLQVNAISFHLDNSAVYVAVTIIAVQPDGAEIKVASNTHTVPLKEDEFNPLPMLELFLSKAGLGRYQLKTQEA